MTEMPGGEPGPAHPPFMSPSTRQGAARQPPFGPSPSAGQLVIGDIVCTPTEVLVPAGRYPIAGTTWIVRDSSRLIERMPAYAIVLAVLFFWFCLLGLLFLLIKEKRYEGYVEVTVQNQSGLYHVTQIPVVNPATVRWAQAQVNHARSLAAAAGGS